jgi:DNA-binding response OmpR family regulator
MADQAHILIVEDDENLRMALEDNLVDEDYLVTAVANGAGARRALLRGGIDLVVLDIMLPDTDGYTLCREIREREQPVVVLMLTARSLESDLVEGFDAGADDYLSKPYRLRELLARVSALLRRKREPKAAPLEQVSFGGNVIDLAGHTVKGADGAEIPLTRTEFDLLACLVRNSNRALSRDEILAAAWDPEVVVDPRTVDNFVSSLKKKLGWSKSAGYRIKTVRGVGYRLEVD